MKNCTNVCIKKMKRWKISRTEKSSYQSLHSVLFLHLLAQLFEAGLQAVVERPQSLGDLLSVDANTFSEMWNLVKQKTSMKNLHLIDLREHGHMPTFFFFFFLPEEHINVLLLIFNLMQVTLKPPALHDQHNR